jgi:ArpU family phage transcriptional regulator
MKKNHMKFQMPRVNEKATKKAVEELMESYRYYLHTLPRGHMPKITQTFSDMPPSLTNQFHSSTENAAIDRLTFEQERNAFMSMIHEAVNKLSPKDMFIITNAYMQEEIGYDVDIYSELGVGRSTYYNLKGKAVLRLAFALQVEVYETRTKEVQTA